MNDLRRTFTLGPCLGRGGFGEVYRAVMRSSAGLETEVAVKILKSDLDLRADAVKRLRDEGRILARLNHPTILKVYDLISLDGRVALVTEYVEGADVADVLSAADPLPLRAAVEVTGMAADALDAAWNAEGPSGPLHLAHRDIKPTNIRIGRHGDVKILDFGIARSDQMERLARTASDLVIGSLPYMAPERFLERKVRSESDIFSLGCTLYEAALGQRFYGSGAMRNVSALASDPERFRAFVEQRVHTLQGSVPDDLADLLQAMLAYNPDHRPTGRAVAARCEALAEALPGIRLRSWCRARVWPDPNATSGTLSGRAISEEGVDDHRPETTDSGVFPIVNHLTPVTVDVSGPVRRSPAPVPISMRTPDAQPRVRTPKPPMQVNLQPVSAGRRTTPVPPPEVHRRKVTPEPSIERTAAMATPIPASTPVPAPPLAYADEPEEPASHVFLYAGSLGFVAVVAPAVGIVLAGVAVWWALRADEPMPPITMVEPEIVEPVVVETPVESPPVEQASEIRQHAVEANLIPMAHADAVETEHVSTPSTRVETPKPTVSLAPLSAEEAYVDVEGSMALELRCGASKYPLPGSVPVGGMCQLYADTGAGMEPRVSLSVGAGSRIRLKCQREPFVCTDQVEH